MTRLFASCAFFCLMLITVPASANSPEVLEQWNSERIEWLSFEEGTAVAKETGRPILIVFHTTWCPHCTRYRKLFFDPRVVAFAEKLVMVLVDRDESPQINSRYDKFGGFIPRTMVLSPQAELIEQIQGPDPEYPYFLDTYEPYDLLGIMKKAYASGHGFE